MTPLCHQVLTHFLARVKGGTSVSSGKFNSTHRFLGLDQVVVNGQPQVGLYKVNKEEIKDVKWTMKTFLQYSTYSKLLEECENHGINNKNGAPFNDKSIKTLLTNKRYIGKWERNRKNKSKKESKLMPYERYAEVDLPHGCLIDLELWNLVQEKVKRIGGNKLRDKATRRVYVLSKLLVYDDGSSFSGSCNWGSISQHTYYRNEKHNIRISAELLEQATRKVVFQVIDNSIELKNAIKKRLSDQNESIDAMGRQIGNLKIALKAIETKKENLDKRLDFLLEDLDREKAKQYRSVYMREASSLNDQGLKLSVQIETLEEQKSIVSRNITLKDYYPHAVEAQARIQEKDPLALRSAYESLFEVIVIGAEDSNGNRRVEFVLKDSNLRPLTGGIFFGVDRRMVGQRGLEPRILRL